MRSVEVDGFLGMFLGHFLVVLLDLEAETLSESRSFYAPSIYMGFGSRFYKQNTDLLAEEGSMSSRTRVEIQRFLTENISQRLAQPRFQII